MSKKTVKAGNFTFDTGLAVPAATRNTTPSELMQKLEAVPVGASFLEEVKLDANVKDAEKETVLRERTNTVRNRVSSAIRRFRIKHPERDFSVRVVNDADLGVGVRVWRKENAKSS